MTSHIPTEQGLGILGLELLNETIDELIEHVYNEFDTTDIFCSQLAQQVLMNAFRSDDMYTQGYFPFIYLYCLFSIFTLFFRSLLFKKMCRISFCAYVTPYECEFVVWCVNG